MAGEKKPVHKIQMTDGKRNIIQQLLQVVSRIFLVVSRIFRK